MTGPVLRRATAASPASSSKRKTTTSGRGGSMPATASQWNPRPGWSQTS